MLFQPSRPPRREKLFGYGRPKPLSRHHKANLMREAERIRRERSAEPGRHVTRADITVLRSLLYTFHNVVTGQCHPKYETIAADAGCARSTVHLSIDRLEQAGLMTWVHRIRRAYRQVKDMFGANSHGEQVRIVRTSNAYSFTVVDDKPSKSENTSGTTNQDLFPSLPAPKPTELARLESSREWIRTRASRAGL